DRFDKPTQLPDVRESSRAVVLKVDFVPIAIDSLGTNHDVSLWQWVDETVVDVGSRRRWIDNGLRLGRVINEERFLTKLGEISMQQDVVGEFLAQADVASEVSHRGRRIPMRLGRRYEMPLRQPIDGSHVTMLWLNERRIGQALQDPQFLFAVTAKPGDKPDQVVLNLRPEIQHGEMKQKWVSSDSALRIDTRRETWTIEELELELTGSTGDTFVIAGTSPLRGLAKQMLSGASADNVQQQIVVLITLDHIPGPIDSL
ncbi:MAG: hypothetical protein MI861_23385, partial [Pirellulales bacterium]|nr:hypothetical protein [Pirellulales bacterium]